MNIPLTEPQIAARTVVRSWLWCLAAMVFVMVIVGGATRLTHSGLSITEWNLVMGTIPPLTPAEWNTAFESYKTIPEYQLINKGMTLPEFKTIFWWEWSHRLLGRLIGLAFLVPFGVFLVTGRLELSQIPRLLVLLALGAFQGALGWFMVKSGLAGRTDVSQYRLAAHLVVGAVIYGALIWTALGIGIPRRRLHGRLTAFSLVIVLALLLQIALGGVVAGLDAGLSYNTFPLMDGRIVPEGLFAMSPWWKNFFENAVTVQFTHRLLAYLIFLTIIIHAWAVTRSGAKSGREITAWLLVAAVFVQGSIGVWTLVSSVPLQLALLHQTVALLVFAIAVIHLHLVTRLI